MTCSQAALLLVLLVSFAGCKQSLENTPLSRLRTQTAAMSDDNLRALTLKYRQACFEHRQKVQDIQAKISSLPVGRQNAEQLNTLKKELRRTGHALEALLARHRVCIDQLTKRGQDVKDLQIKSLSE